jgi:CRP-like cAMP-binding protein
MSALSDVIDRLPAKQFAAGAVLIEQGTHADQLYFLMDGHVEVLKDGALIVDISEHGAIFGEMSVLLYTPHTATVRVRAPSTFRVAGASWQFLRDNPDMALYVASILARRLDSLNPEISSWSGKASIKTATTTASSDSASPAPAPRRGTSFR